MGLLPIFEEYEQSPKETGIFYLKSISPTSFDLDPYWYFMANDFNVAIKDERYNTFDLNIRKDSVKQYVRTIGLRGPIMYSGWGYDICGLPAPNQGQNSLKFDTETSYNRAVWKSGPIDFRWDDKRKVWVGGVELLEGIMVDDLAAPADIDSPTTAGGNVYRGVNLAVRQESVTLTNRNPKLSLQKDDYFIAAKINYEWRPLGGGAGAGGKTVQENKMILLLGTYDQYSGCPSAPAKPPVFPGQGNCNNNFCANQYAWSRYKICGYKYYKVETYENKFWASELNSDSTACDGAGVNPNFKFCPAIFKGVKGKLDDPNAACDGGVRFWNAGGGGRSCGCAQFPWLKQCIRSRGKFISRPDFGDPEVIPNGCEQLVQAMDEGGWWGQTTSWTEMCLLSAGLNCLWGPEDLGPFSIALIARAITPENNPCFTGPPVYDPCLPCDGFMEFVNSVTSNKLAGCGGNTYFGNVITIDDIKSIFKDCSIKRYTNFTWCPSCSIQAVEWVEYTCCATNDGDGSC